MYAVVRESTLRPEAGGQLPEGRQEFAALRAKQPGHRGSVTIDAGDGRMVTITLWESEQAQQTAAPILRPHAERLINVDTTVPPQITAQGQVVADDLTTR